MFEEANFCKRHNRPMTGFNTLVFCPECEKEGATADNILRGAATFESWTAELYSNWATFTMSGKSKRYMADIVIAGTLKIPVILNEQIGSVAFQELKKGDKIHLYGTMAEETIPIGLNSGAPMVDKAMVINCSGYSKL